MYIYVYVSFPTPEPPGNLTIYILEQSILIVILAGIPQKMLCPLPLIDILG